VGVLCRVIGFCEFVPDTSDVRELRRASDRSVRDAWRIVLRHGGSLERLLYDRATLVFDSIEADEAALAALELLSFADVALGLAAADEPTARWGRAHVVARALAHRADVGDVLVDDCFRWRLGSAFRCEPVRPGSGRLRAWRLLSQPRPPHR
jgi:hypothetical protein